jgi:hypothetical protein
MEIALNDFMAKLFFGWTWCGGCLMQGRHPNPAQWNKSYFFVSYLSAPLFATKRYL